MCAVKIEVDWIANICCIQGSCIVVAQSQAVDVFPEPIEIIVFRQGRFKLYELVFINDFGVFS